jgi:transcriptional regulator with XRE-family HTH domain
MTISLKQADTFEISAADMLEIGRKVKAARETNGYTIEALAVTSGLTASEITAIEDGLSTNIGHVRRVANALKLALPDLAAA